MQPWVLYTHKLKINEFTLNRGIISTAIDVCSTFDLAFNDTVYKNKNTIDILDEQENINYYYENKEKKVNKKLFNVDTNTYENIIYNKTDKAIKLFDKFDNEILNIDKKIFRNYLIKGAAYKHDGTFLTVTVWQKFLRIAFHRDIKQFDYKNILQDNKSVVEGPMLYFTKIDENSDFNYIVEIVKKYYEWYTTPREKPVDRYFDILLFKIQLLGEDITRKEVIRGTEFKTRNNFILLTKQINCIYLKILNVNNDAEILKPIGRKVKEPLSLYYKVYNEEDIDTIMPYIKESYEISKYNALDYHYGLTKYYYEDDK